jgi:hypothetical protein
MGSYLRPKSGTSGHSDLQQRSEAASDQIHDLPLREFEKLGEEEVRLRLQFQVFDEDTAQRAQDWLDEREYAQFGDDIRSTRSFAARASELARDSVRLASTAQQLACDAHATAEEAEAMARMAKQTADNQLRQSARMAKFGLIAAIIALAVSIGVLVYR